MKKSLCLTALIAGLMALSMSAKAQTIVERPFDVSISYGGPQYMPGWIGGAETTFSAMTEFRYTPTKWVSIGLLGGLRDSGRSASLGPLMEGEPEPETHYYFNLMLMVYGNWITTEKFKLYSGVGYGTKGGYVKSDGHPSHGFQFTPVGASYGKRVYGFAELGMGWMFCPARAGIGFRF